MEDIAGWITAVATSVAAFGIVFGAYQVRAAYQNIELMRKSIINDHEWRRRHYTSEILIDWNNSARPHIAYLSRKYPEFQSVPDFIGERKIKSTWGISVSEAEKIFHGRDLDAQETRDHLIELMNYLEGIAVAWEKNVVDRDFIRDSCGVAILDTCTFFSQFILTMTENRRREPWPPLSRVVNVWEAEDLRAHLEEQAKSAIKSHENSKNRLDERSPTGTFG